MRHRRFGFDLRLHQCLDALPYAVEPQFKRLRRLALPNQRFAQPDRGRNKHQRDEHDDDPGELGEKRLRGEGIQYRTGFMPLGQNQKGQRQHEQRAANSRNIAHGKVCHPGYLTWLFGTTAGRGAQVQRPTRAVAAFSGCPGEETAL